MRELIAYADADPWLEVEGVLAGSPDDIGVIAGRYLRAASHVAEAAQIFESTRSRLSQAYRVMPCDASGVAESLISDSDSVRALSGALADSAERLRRKGMWLDDTASSLSALQHDCAGLLSELDYRLNTLDPLDVDAGVECITATQHQVGRRIADYAVRLSSWSELVDDLAETAPISRDRFGIPGATTAPEDLAAWWQELTTGERAKLVNEHPEVIGNRNGIPCADRDRANRLTLSRDLSSGNPVRVRNAVRTQEGLAHNANAAAAVTLLLTYAPEAFDGSGGVAISLGDPDSADNVAVVVPGTGADVRGGWFTNSSDAPAHLYTEANAANPAASTAVVAWLGYRTPRSIVDPAVATPDLARRGARALAADVNGLAVTTGGAHLTVIGHSYGATTAADAAVTGMAVDDLVLLGCPGTDLAGCAADLRLGGGRVYVGDASTDPVGRIGSSDALADRLRLGAMIGLGPDPASDDYGAIRFRAEVPGTKAVEVSDHSHYYERGSESLYSMADIVSGHGSELGAHGMLAEPRNQPRLRISAGLLSLFGVPDIAVALPGTADTEDPESSRKQVSDNHFHSST